MADHNAGKLYSHFLKWLIEKDLYNALEEKITIKKIAADFKTDTARVTKWIREIYDDIFELNYDKPELFQKSVIKVCLDFSNYDDYCTFYTSLPVFKTHKMKVTKLVSVFILIVVIIILFYSAKFYNDNITFHIYDTYIILAYRQIAYSLVTIVGVVFLFKILFKANRQNKN